MIASGNLKTSRQNQLAVVPGQRLSGASDQARNSLYVMGVREQMSSRRGAGQPAFPLPWLGFMRRTCATIRSHASSMRPCAFGSRNA